MRRFVAASIRLLMLVLVLSFVPHGGSAANAATTVVATGLAGPVKLTSGPGGGALVAEAGHASSPNSGAVSWVAPSGGIRRLVTGLPSGPFEQGVSSGPASVVLEGEATLIVLIGGGDATVPGAAPGTQVANPTGGSSPLLASILELRFSRPVHKIAHPFTLRALEHVALALGVPVKLTNAAGDQLLVSLLTNLPDHLPRARQGGVRNANPYGMDRVGDTLFVADAGQDGVWRVNRHSGRAQIEILFPALANPLPFGPPVTDFVPTSVRALGPNNILVSNLSGFPFATGNAGVWRVGAAGHSPLLENLTTVTDVLPVRRSGGGTDYFVLEYSVNFRGTPQAPGRLLRFSSPGAVPQVLAADLVSPTGMVVERSAGALWVTEFFTGRIVRVAIP